MDYLIYPDYLNVEDQVSCSNFCGTQLILIRNYRLLGS